MKRFVVFMYDERKPRGGWRDILRDNLDNVYSFDTAMEALDTILEMPPLEMCSKVGIRHLWENIHADIVDLQHKERRFGVILAGNPKKWKEEKEEIKLFIKAKQEGKKYVPKHIREYHSLPSKGRRLP